MAKEDAKERKMAMLLICDERRDFHLYFDDRLHVGRIWHDRRDESRVLNEALHIVVVVKAELLMNRERQTRK